MLTAQQTLRKEYCPPLDEATFFAITSDHDLASPDGLHDCVAILNALRQGAIEQENAEFDPSGTGGAGFTHNDEYSGSHSSPEESSTSLGVTSITTGLSELRWDDKTDIGTDLEDMSFEEKQQYLCDMFITTTTITPFTISCVLKQCKGVLCQAIDELLTLSALEHEEYQSADGQSPIPKGIDGFLGQQNAGRGRRGKSKKPRTGESSRASSVPSTLNDVSNGRRNVWTSSDEDVDFICSRTNVAPKVVKSTYHANGASVSATIRSLSSKVSADYQNLNDLNPLLQLSVVELSQEFGFLTEPQVYGLLTIARNNPSAARELAEVLISAPEPVQTGKVNGFAHYKPFIPTDEGESHASRMSSPLVAVDPSQTRFTAASHSAAAGLAYTKAAAAYKRGKSDHLMGGVAGYYADVGREQVKAAKALNAAAADALVMSQSSPRAIDLHGVSVADAVRIANARVNIWWESLGDARYAPGGGGPAREGFRIVTGIGRHSKDGAPRIGPAVSRMLIREGWKVEVGQGETIVYGKARH